MRFIPCTLVLLIGCEFGPSPEVTLTPLETMICDLPSEPVTEEVEAPCDGRAATLDADSAAEVWDAMATTLPIVQLQTAHTIMTDIAEALNRQNADGCVDIRTYELTGLTVYEGDCTIQDASFSGRITALEERGLTQIFYEDVAIDDGEFAFTASGSWSYLAADFEYFQSDITISYDYGNGAEVWSLVTSATWTDEIFEQQGWHEIIAAPEGRASGAFCFDAVEQVSETCETGRDGSLSLEGASDWAFSWGESEDCAECISVTRDGVAEEPYCD